MTTSNRKLTTRRGALVFASALATLAVASTSFAGPRNEMAPSVAVSYSDLDLSSDAGVKALYRRITSAARAVCPDAYSRDLGVSSASDRCQANAIAQAVAELNNSKLAMVHASHATHG